LEKVKGIKEVVMPKKANPIQLQKFLKGVNYPAGKSILLKHAKERGADENVMYTLEKLPDKDYQGPAGIAREVGKIEVR
jgi:hypothetical protein